MTYPMAATDQYPAMHHSWGNWPPMHMQGAYGPPRWQSGLGSSSFYGQHGAGLSDYRSEKPPLTQLQELTSVFPHLDEPYIPCQRGPTPSFATEPHFPINDRFCDRECDSGYAPDSIRTDRLCEREADAGYASDRPSLDEGPYSVETPAPRECDSGFGPTFHAKEEPDTFETCGDCDSGCARDASQDMNCLMVAEQPPPDTPTRDAFADSDSGCADLTGKWEECSPQSALPGFQQAFGSTEIGRFSRNDFFTNPSPPRSAELPAEPPRKAARKTRTPRVKQMRKDQSESPRPRADSRREVPNVPLPEMQCHGRPCAGPYDGCVPRYCPGYSTGVPSSYSYGRPGASPAQHAYSPYMRPFPFPLPCSQSWSEPRWPPSQYQQPYQPQQSWTSANVYPFMRLDY